MTESTMKPLDYLRGALKAIDERPDLWDQAYFARKTECGTAFCVAGWVCSLAGYKPKFDSVFGDLGVTARLTTGDSVYFKAQELLGIDE
jgi:hypothetical protein